MVKRLAVVIAASVSVGCGGVTLPSDPGTEGVIVERDVRNSFSGDAPTIWVKEDLEDECGTIYMVAPETVIRIRTADGKLRKAVVSDLEAGDRVRVWAEYELRSCPGQSTAEAIEILSPR